MSQLKDSQPEEDYDSDEYFEPEEEEENNATPTHFEAPQFTRPGDLKQEVVRKVNESGLKLSCAASGFPAPKVSWFKNGAPLNRTGTHEGRWAIVLDHLLEEDSGMYQCAVCNEVACIENEFNVTISDQKDVLFGARFTKKMEFISKIFRPLGNMFKIKCPAAGNPEPNITWTKDNLPIKRKMDHPVNYVKWGIVLEDIMMEDSGNYTCTVCNSIACSNFTYEIFVQGKSKSFPKPENLIASRTEDGFMDVVAGDLFNSSHESNATNEIPTAPFFLKKHMNALEMRPSGSTFTFKCPHGGHPAPNITWTKDERPISRTLGHFRRGKSSITLEDVISTDSGHYKCLICNEVDCIKHVFKFEVLGK